MTHNPSIRAFAPHEWRTYRELRLRALADAPDAFGRTLAEEKARPESFWIERLATATDRRWNLPLLAEVDGEPVGLAWGRIEVSEPEEAAAYQMWVAPEHRGQGIGRMLLETIVAWAREANVHRLVLDVTIGNRLAVQLYTRAGFQPAGEPQPVRPGSELREQPMVLELREGRRRGHRPHLAGRPWLEGIRLMLLAALGAVLLALPYLFRAFGPTEAEVVTWGQVCLSTGAALVLLSIALRRSRKCTARLVLGAGYLFLALLQVLPIYLWFTFHGTGISDGTPASQFVAHWAFSIPHLALLMVSLAVLWQLLRRAPQPAG
jgi:GNAT superfamily N-acetyltransferase